MNLKIVSQLSGGDRIAYREHTKVTDVDTGEMLKDAVRVDWHHDTNGYAVGTVHLGNGKVLRGLALTVNIEGEFTEDRDEYIMPARQELQILEDDQPNRPRETNLKIKYKVGPAYFNSPDVIYGRTPQQGVADAYKFADDSQRDAEQQ